MRSRGATDWPTLAELRVRGGLTKSELARELGVHPSQVIRWESGRQTIPAHLTPRYAAALGVSLAHLMAAIEQTREEWAAQVAQLQPEDADRRQRGTAR